MIENDVGSMVTHEGDYDVWWCDVWKENLAHDKWYLMHKKNIKKWGTGMFADTWKRMMHEIWWNETWDLMMAIETWWSLKYDNAWYMMVHVFGVWCKLIYGYTAAAYELTWHIIGTRLMIPDIWWFYGKRRPIYMYMKEICMILYDTKWCTIYVYKDGPR